jgi:hypothetical protein
MNGESDLDCLCFSHPLIMYHMGKTTGLLQRCTRRRASGSPRPLITHSTTAEGLGKIRVSCLSARSPALSCPVVYPGIIPVTSASTSSAPNAINFLTPFHVPP